MIYINGISRPQIKSAVVTDTTGADGKVSVSFAEAFASTPMVTVQLENDVDYYPVVTAKSTTGFTVKILKTAHTHSNPNTSADSAGTPAGSISSVSAGTPAGTIGAEAAHTHGISFTSGAGSSHRHSNPSTGSAGSHAHAMSGSTGSGSAHKHSQGVTGIPSATITVAIGIITDMCPSGHADCIVVGPETSPAASEGHTHTNPDTAYESLHTHSLPDTVSSGMHTHTIGNTGYESSHTHAVSGTSGAGSSHSHSFTGSALPTHSHTFTGNALGTHSHTIGDTGSSNAGNPLANTSVTFSYIAVAP